PPPAPPLRRLGPEVNAELEDSRLWEAFAAVGTEMIITKSGRRMFPSLKLRLNGLEPDKRYCVYLTVEPVADCRWKFQSSRWLVVGKGEPAPAHRCFMHPDSPASGAHWLKQPVSFLRMKLTNNGMDPHGHIILNSMHKYRPRLYVAEIEESAWLPSRFVAYGSFDFPLAEFIAVTAYQNQRITQLKIDCNPFAKGFRVTGK
uniref:T-box domain-containing protein n=1 Tax=Macrostomum lignano TaxID=282301 RepID=A0A1I8I3X6_9PLAT